MFLKDHLIFTYIFLKEYYVIRTHIYDIHVRLLIDNNKIKLKTLPKLTI